MAARSGELATTPDREIVVTRVFDAPRALVFEVWTDPAHVAQWFGPHGFTTTVDEMDVRPGGVWRFTMYGPDGTDYPSRVVFVEVVRPARLVYTHDAGEEGDVKQFHVTVTFDDAGGQTRLTMRMVFESPAERDRMIEEVGAVEGANQTLERLAAYLATA